MKTGKKVTGSERLSQLSHLILKGGKGLVAVLAAYFDASGLDDKSPCLVMGGFVAPVEKWIKFEREWADLLRDRKLEYAHGRKLKGWLGKKHDQFYFETNYLLKRAVLFGVAATLRHKDYHEIFPDNRLSAKDSPYGFAFRAAMVAVCVHVHESLPGEEIAFVLESGDPGQGGAKRMAEYTIFGGDQIADMRTIYPIKSFTFADKKDFGALQVADMHAYCKLKSDEEKRNRKKGVYKGPINMLLSGLNVSHFELTKDELRTHRINLLERKGHGRTDEWIKKEVKSAIATIRRGPKTNAK